MRGCYFTNEYGDRELAGLIWHRARGEYVATPYDGTAQRRTFTNYHTARRWCIARCEAFWLEH